MKEKNTQMDYTELANHAISATQKAYAPYSGYKVGAALLSENGKIYLGSNIENASFSATVCAERTAFFSAVSNGEKNFLAIAVAGGKDGVIENVFPPCGICRQVMAEFCNENFDVVLCHKNGYKVYSLADILPLFFSKNNITEKEDLT